VYAARSAAQTDAQDLAPTPAGGEDRALDVGLAILVTWHDRQPLEWVSRCLTSIEDAAATAGHRNFAIFAAVDGATSNHGRALVHTARSHASAARRMVAHGFTKAVNISVAKNRCLRLWLPFASEFPWFSMVDGDDLCLPGKFRWLFPQLLAAGVRRAGGEYILREPGHPDQTIPVSRCLDHFACGVWQSIFHRSLVPTNGRFFDESASDDFFDDCFVWSRLEHEREPWPQFPGDPVALVRVHGANFCSTRPGGWQAACDRTLAEAQRRYPRRWLYGDNIITAAWGEPHLREAELAVKSFILANRDHSPRAVHVYAPATEAQRIIAWNQCPGLTAPILHRPVEPFLAQAHGRRELQAIRDPDHRSMALNCFVKWLTIRHANASLGRLIYMDADILWLHHLCDIPWLRFGLMPESIPPTERADWATSAYGHINGGLIKLGFDADPLVNLVLDGMLDSNPRWDNPASGSVSDHPFPPWADQGPMAQLVEAAMGECDYFNPATALNLSVCANGYGQSRLAHLATHDVLPAVASHIGLVWNLDPQCFFRGHLLQGLHGHLQAPSWWKIWPRFMSSLVHAKFQTGSYQHLAPIIEIIPKLD
jgi:hypothetical protein